MKLIYDLKAGDKYYFLGLDGTFCEYEVISTVITEKSFNINYICLHYNQDMKIVRKSIGHYRHTKYSVAYTSRLECFVRYRL